MDLSPLWLPHKIDKKEKTRMVTHFRGFFLNTWREWIGGILDLRPRDHDLGTGLTGHIWRVRVNEDMVLGPVPYVADICV
jgi:hypothetical protein